MDIVESSKVPENKSKTWCTPHDMHPKDCFDLHHPKPEPAPYVCENPECPLGGKCLGECAANF